MSVAIVTDSTADIPKNLVEKNKITVVPLYILFGEDTYTDNGADITIEEFYRKLKTSDVLPTTTQPTPSDFIKIYQQLLEEHNSIISIHISKKMSGTIASAEMAKKELQDKDISIIDSELVHMPLGFLALKAAELAQQGKSKQEIIEGVNKLKSKINVLFSPPTLEYLKRGGRIGRAKALLASLLEIKPILTIFKGEVSPYKNTRRWNQAKNEIINSMKNIIENGKNMIVSVGDSDAKEDGNEMAERIKNTFNPKQLLRVDIGCIVGTHLGPGAIGITFYED